MFENIVTSFKTLTATDKSMGQFKIKVSESVDAFKRRIISTSDETTPKNISKEGTLDDTTQLNPLFYDNINNFPKCRLADAQCVADPYRLVYGSFMNVESDEESDEDIVNRFARVVNTDDDSCQLKSKFILNNSIRRRNDREEIRRRLASGDVDEYTSNDRPGKKPSLQSRLQSGMNLQICFMNETMSDTESPSSDQDSPAKTSSSNKNNLVKSQSTESRPKPTAVKPVQPSFNELTMPVPKPTPKPEEDFFAQQVQLQANARQALAEAKELARKQMEAEKQRSSSPITDMLRASLTKVGVPFSEERRRLSRQLLTNMNVAQLQVIVNDLHTQIEYLNEDLVKLLMERDELHMGQDSMLVDIEDLTRYLGAKEKSLKDELRKNSNQDTIRAITAPIKSRVVPLSKTKK